MKLRLRSFETKETLKLEIPNPCTLDNLRELISQNLPSSSQPPTIRFSLNRKDEITPASPDESIQSIGITSGDLIHFTTNPNGFSTTPQTLIPKSVQPQIPQILIPKSEQPQIPQTLIPKSEQPQIPQTLIPESEQPQIPQTVIPNSTNPNSEQIPEYMEIDEDENSVIEIDKSFSVPSFLRKVFTEEVGHDTNLNKKLLPIAIHAVLLESGFVEIDPVSNTLKTNNFDLQRNLYLATFHYTLPEIITNSTLPETVKIKFQNIGKYCKVYGSLTNGATTVHSVLLDENKLVPFLNVVWANCGHLLEHMEGEKSTLPETEVFEFWKKTKDGLALPLLIDLCEKSGLVLPPCFMRLPTELKLKILESISGKDVANVSCVCSELRYLGSSEELWKQKYIEEFGNRNGRSFKEMFKRESESRKRRNLGTAPSSFMRRRYSYIPFGPPHFPRIIGGDYDLFVPNPGQLGLPGGGIRRLRFAGPHYNLDRQ